MSDRFDAEIASIQTEVFGDGSMDRDTEVLAPVSQAEQQSSQSITMSREVSEVTNLPAISGIQTDIDDVPTRKETGNETHMPSAKLAIPADSATPKALQDGSESSVLQSHIESGSPNDVCPLPDVMEPFVPGATRRSASPAAAESPHNTAANEEDLSNLRSPPSVTSPSSDRAVDVMRPPICDPPSCDSNPRLRLLTEHINLPTANYSEVSVIADSQDLVSASISADATAVQATASIPSPVAIKAASSLSGTQGDSGSAEAQDLAPSRDVLLSGAVHHFRLKPQFDVSQVLERNAKLADMPNRRYFPRKPSSPPSAEAVTHTVIRRHLIRKDDLLARIREQSTAVHARSETLRSEYKRLDALWRADCEMLEKSEALKPPPVLFAGFPSTASQTPAVPSSTPLLEDGTPVRANRRRDTSGFSGDAVRTDAEFEEIMGFLLDADMRDPNLRAAKTTAVVPDMELGIIGKEDFDDQNGLVTDPVKFYGAESDQAANWTEEEREAFLKGYLQWPKQFGKVTKRLLPSKTASDAVLYYYRTKKVFDYKQALGAKGGQRRRRPGTGRRPGKSSLMDGLSRQQPSMLDAPEEGPRLPDRFAAGGLLSREESPVMSDSLEDADTYGGNDTVFQANPRFAASKFRLKSGGEGVSDVDSSNDAAALQMRKRKVSQNENAGERPPRKKAATSSYWSTAEKVLVSKLLSSNQPPDFALISTKLENKSAQQVRNFFFNHKADVLSAGKASQGHPESLSEPGSNLSNASVTAQSDGEGHQTAGLPRTGLFQPMPNALHSLVSDISVQERRASTGVVGSELGRARGLNIAALLNEEVPESGDSERRKKEVMGEWFGREDSRPRESPASPMLDDAASDGTEEDLHVGT